jgi:hypothetical protein
LFLVYRFGGAFTMADVFGLCDTKRRDYTLPGKNGGGGKEVGRG